MNNDKDNFDIFSSSPKPLYSSKYDCLRQLPSFDRMKSVSVEPFTTDPNKDKIKDCVGPLPSLGVSSCLSVEDQTIGVRSVL